MILKPCKKTNTQPNMGIKNIKLESFPELFLDNNSFKANIVDG